MPVMSGVYDSLDFPVSSKNTKLDHINSYSYSLLRPSLFWCHHHHANQRNDLCLGRHCYDKRINIFSKKKTTIVLMLVTSRLIFCCRWIMWIWHDLAISRFRCCVLPISCIFSICHEIPANLSGWDRIAVAAVKEISPGRPSQNWIFGRDFCGNKSWISWYFMGRWSTNESSKCCITHNSGEQPRAYRATPVHHHLHSRSVPCLSGLEGNCFFGLRQHEWSKMLVFMVHFQGLFGKVLWYILGTRRSTINNTDCICCVNQDRCTHCTTKCNMEIETESIDKDVYMYSDHRLNQVIKDQLSDEAAKKTQLSKNSLQLLEKSSAWSSDFEVNVPVFQLESLRGNFFNTSKQHRETPIYGVPWATLPWAHLLSWLGQRQSQLSLLGLIDSLHETQC